MKIKNERIKTKNDYRINILFCQHCKAMQKTNNTVVDCWYNPLEHGKEYAFCASNCDACDAMITIISEGLK